MNNREIREFWRAEIDRACEAAKLAICNRYTVGEIEHDEALDLQKEQDRIAKHLRRRVGELTYFRKERAGGKAKTQA